MNYLNEVVRTIERKLPRNFDLLTDDGRIAIKADGLKTSDSLVMEGGVNWFSARTVNRYNNRIASSVNGNPDEEVDRIVKWLLDSYKERK